MGQDLDSGTKRGPKRRWIAIGIAAAVVLGVVGPSAYALIQGTLYAQSGRAATLATYANAYPLPPSPGGAAFDGSNFWVASASGSLTKINQGTGVRNDYQITTNGGCNNPLAVAFDGTFVWTANASVNLLTGSVCKFSPSTGSVVSNINLGANFPQAIAFDGLNIWTANPSTHSVSKIVISTGAVTTQSLTAGSSPSSLAFDLGSGSGNIWTANPGNNTVSKISVADPTSFVSFPVSGGTPKSIAFDGTYMWTANFNGTVSKITRAGVVEATYPVSTSGIPQSPQSIAFDQPGYTASGTIDPLTYMWVANFGLNTVAKVDIRTGNVVATYPVGRSPYSIVFDGVSIWVVERSGPSVSRIRVR